MSSAVPGVSNIVRTGDARIDFTELLAEHLASGYQMLYTPTSEEARVMNEIRTMMERRTGNSKYGVITWDCFEGFQGENLKITDAERQSTQDPVAALRVLAENTVWDGKSGPKPRVILPSRNLYIFNDMDDFFKAPPICRALRALFASNRLVNREHHRPMLILSPILQLPPKLRGCMTVIDFSLPNEAQIDRSIEFIRGSWAAKHRNDVSKGVVAPELREQLASTMLGLTTIEVENSLSRALNRHEGFTAAMIPTLKDEKASIISKSEVLTYKDDSQIVSRDQIGGFGEYLKFIDLRCLAYTKQARELRIDPPKGVVIIGPPGTGKSIVAEATAKIAGLPLYTLDVGAIFGSLVGESEQRMRDALKQITAQQGCVLLIDEADKAFGNAHDSRGDSGVTQRVFGQLLAWLSSKEDCTFVIMTMNRTIGIPPEFLRAGRFDAVFYTDLPNPTERQQILNIHFGKRGVAPASLSLGQAEWDAIVEKTEGWVGSELEQLVKEARYKAFAGRREGIPDFTDIISVLPTITPMSTLDEEGINAIRAFCKNRARPVTLPEEKQQRRARQGRGFEGGGTN